MIPINTAEYRLLYKMEEIACPLCGKRIRQADHLDLEYVHTVLGHTFLHTACVEKLKRSRKK